MRRGITIPMAGIAGHVARTGEVVNLADVYEVRGCYS
jgi:hypothetical protein